MKDKNTFKERFKYWFDNQMSKGTSAMMLMLVAMTLVLIIIISSIIQVFGLAEDGTMFSSFWDIMASTINAWMPYSDDGGIGYILLTAVSAIVGVFFTSFLIGIISTAIEDKLTQLRKGNSLVLENGHIVLLGLKHGEYELIHQLILAADQEERCILVAEEMEKDEMEDAIRENLEIPSNIHIICRNVDICDPQSLECCALADARVIIVNPIEDARTVKIMLAVSKLLENENANVQIVAAVGDREYLIPEEICKKRGMLMLKTNHVIARIIAHACTQPGLSEAFSEVFDFEGNDLYIKPLEAAVGKSFGEVTAAIDSAVPVGIMRDDVSILSPSANEIIRETDELILFAKSRNDARYTELKINESKWNYEENEKNKALQNIVVIGMNDAFDTLVTELPERTGGFLLTFAGMDEEQIAFAEKCLRKREDVSGHAFTESLRYIENMEKLVEAAHHVVVLSDYSLPEDDADMKVMMKLLQLRDIKLRLGYDFTVTTEMRREDNRRLALDNSPVDFIVSSHMSAMILVQLAENPRLYSIFKELLSNQGKEFFLKRADEFAFDREAMTVATMRSRLLSKNLVLLGYFTGEGEERKLILNPPLKDMVHLHAEDELVVIGEQG